MRYILPIFAYLGATIIFLLPVSLGVFVLYRILKTWVPRSLALILGSALSSATSFVVASFQEDYDFAHFVFVSANIAILIVLTVGLLSIRNSTPPRDRLVARLRRRFKRSTSQQTTPVTDRLWSDDEILNKDDDGFGFSEYAEVLRDRILNTGTPFTIGIVGSWGSGKSSLMNLLKATIANEKNVATIKINVWELGTQEEVWHAFLQAVFSGIYRNIPWYKKIDWRKLLDQAMRSSWRVLVAATPVIVAIVLKRRAVTWPEIFNLITFQSRDYRLAGAITHMVALFTLYKPAWDAVRKSLKFDVNAVLKAGSYEAQITELMKLRTRFERVVKLAVGVDGRVVVFIDDLDRCTPDKIPDVLEAIKLFAATKGCVYVLAFDQDIVAGRIAKKYQFDREEGINYLEKIVQIPFTLPPLDKNDIGSFIRKYYPELGWVNADVFAKGLTANPRTVKRALNTYRLICRMSERRVAAWEIEPLDPELVAKMVVIQMRFKRLYERLPDEPQLLIKVEQWARSNRSFNQEGPYQFTDLIDPQHASALKLVLSSGTSFFEAQDVVLPWYIFLGGDSVGMAEDHRPDSQYREALLSNDPLRIKEAFDEIERFRSEDWIVQIRETYRQRLSKILGDIRYSPEQRLSATLAMDILDGHQSGPPNPETVRVPSRRFVIGGLTLDDLQTARAAGVDLTLTNENQASYRVMSTDFRIGRYPITNEQFGQFYAEFSSPGQWFGVLSVMECEAYFRPCEPAKQPPGADLPHPVSYEVAFDHFAAFSSEPETCAFFHRDKSTRTEVTCISLSLDRPTKSTAGDSEPGVLTLKVPHWQSNFSFKIQLGDGFAVRQVEGPEATILNPTGAKFGFQIGPIRVRLRLLIDGVEVGRHLAPQQPFEAEIAVWDLSQLHPLSFGKVSWQRPTGKDRHPAKEVTWDEAALFCLWLRDKTGLPYRLPTQLEWELAATGGDGRFFPWGNEWIPSCANTLDDLREDEPAETSAVDQHPLGDSPFCCADMAGNVWEWCADSASKTFEAGRTGYTWQDVRLHGTPDSELHGRMVRGGSHASRKSEVTTFYRRHTAGMWPDVGFRVAVSSGWEGVKFNEHQAQVRDRNTDSQA